jgi:hypothetical protein
MFDKKTYYREYYKKHREEISKARKDSYSGEHAEELRRKALEYYHAHKEEIQAKNKERYHTDEEYREYRRRHSRESARRRKERAELALPEECINV